MFNRIGSTCFAFVLCSFIVVSGAKASPLEFRDLCGASQWLPAFESGNSACRVLISPAHEEQIKSDEVSGWSPYDSSTIVRLAAPFSWNFADAFETLPASEAAEAVSALNGDRLSQRSGSDPNCDAGCSTVLSSVPEPASMLFVGSALLLLGALVRGRIDL